jgi:hypothetical protein
MTVTTRYERGKGIVLWEWCCLILPALYILGTFQRKKQYCNFFSTLDDESHPHNVRPP